jgi:hypothetical protein
MLRAFAPPWLEIRNVRMKSSPGVTPKESVEYEINVSNGRWYTVGAGV